MRPPSNPKSSSNPPEDFPQFLTFRGRRFEISGDTWVQFDDGDRYEIALAHDCLDCDIQVCCFEKDRDAAMARACAELYEIVVNHQTRCPNCQAELVDELLRGGYGLESRGAE